MYLVDQEGNPKYTKITRNRINSKSTLLGLNGAIANNTHSYPFPVGPYERWIPLLSEWKVVYRLASNAGGPPRNQLASNAGICPSMNNMLNVWQNVKCYANDILLDEMNEGIAECAAVRDRLWKSKSWFDTVGKTRMWDSSEITRRNYIVNDAPLQNNNLASLTIVAELYGAAGYNIGIGAGGVGNAFTIVNLGNASSTITWQQNNAAGVAGQALPGNLPNFISPGDRFTFGGVEYTVTGVLADAMEISPRIGAAAAANTALGQFTNIKKIVPIANLDYNVSSYNRKDVQEQYFKFPLGIEYVNQEMPPANYRFDFKGYTYQEFAKRFIESTIAVGDRTVGVNFSIDILELYYFPYIVEVPERLDDGEVIRTFKCLESQKKHIISDRNQISFSVKSNSTELGFCLQDGRAGINSVFSPSIFRIYNGAGLPVDKSLNDANNVDKKLSYYSIKYGNQTKPVPAQEDDLNDARSLRVVQSYIETFKNSGAYYYEGGMESLNDHLLRGRIFWHLFPRDKNMYSSTAQLICNFTGIVANDLDTAFAILFCAFYRTIKMTIQNGQVVNVDRNI